MSITLWLLPGMGNDERVFSELMPLLPSDWTLRTFAWLEPMSEQEPIEAYAQRWLQTQVTTALPERLWILGYSLGGLLAQALCRQLPAERLFLVASAQERSEMPWYFPILRRWPLHRKIPKAWTLKILPWAAQRSGILPKGPQLNLLVSMLKACSPLHFSWGRNTAIYWDKLPINVPVERLHGEKDHIFSAKKLANTSLVLPKASHALMLDQAQEVAHWLMRFV